MRFKLKLFECPPPLPPLQDLSDTLNHLGNKWRNDKEMLVEHNFRVQLFLGSVYSSPEWVITQWQHYLSWPNWPPPVQCPVTSGWQQGCPLIGQDWADVAIAWSYACDWQKDCSLGPWQCDAGASMPGVRRIWPGRQRRSLGRHQVVKINCWWSRSILFTVKCEKTIEGTHIKKIHVSWTKMEDVNAIINT